MKKLLGNQNLALMALAGGSTAVLLIITSYVVWTLFLQYQFPIPLLGFTLTYIAWPYNTFLFWLFIPKKLRQSRNLQKRILIVFMLAILVIVYDVCSQIIIQKMRTSAEQYQPIIALVLPVWREAITSISIAMIRKSANGDERFSMMFVKYLLNTAYSLLLCIVLGSIATNTTAWVIPQYCLDS